MPFDLNEIAVRDERERERLSRRHDLAKWTLVPFVWLTSAYIPLKAITGHSTSLNVNFSFTVALSLVVGANIAAAMYRQVRKVDEVNTELRDRIRNLEAAMEGMTA